MSKQPSAATQSRVLHLVLLGSLSVLTQGALVCWDGGGGFSWTNPFKWTGDTLPSRHDEVTIVALETGHLALFGMPGKSFRIGATTNLHDRHIWTFEPTVALTNAFPLLLRDTTTMPVRFCRAMEE